MKRLIICLGMVAVLLLGNWHIAFAIHVVPDPGPPGVDILASDFAGRFVIADRSGGTNGALQLDRLTNRVKALAPFYIVSADGSATITIDRHWVDTNTGASVPVPEVGSVFLLTADGRSYVTGDVQPAKGWLIVGATQQRVQIPVAGFPVALSADGRYVLVRGACSGFSSKLGAEACDISRWDSVTGRVDLVVHRRTGELLASDVANTGRVIVSTNLNTRMYARDPGSAQKRLGPNQNLRGFGQLSDDGQIFAWQYSPTNCCQAVGVIDIASNHIQEGVFGWSTASTPFSPSPWRLSGDGSRLLTRGRLDPSPQPPVTVEAVHVLGRAISPRVGPEEMIRVPVAGVLGVGPDATAVMISVTVTEPNASGFLTVWPCGQPRPLTSNVNFSVGQTIANAALVKVGEGGAICSSSNVGVNSIIDVQGWFGSKSDYHPLEPLRLADTRDGETDKIGRASCRERV